METHSHISHQISQIQFTKMVTRFPAAILTFASLLNGGNAVAQIDPRLLLRSGGQTQNVIVSFTAGIRSVLDEINQRKFSNLTEKRDALVTAQQTHADTVQAELKEILNSEGMPFESFWISNSVIVPNADSRIVNIISEVPGVAKVEKEPEVKVLPVEKEEILITGNRTRTRRQESPQWNIMKIYAHLAWWRRNIIGKGIVVAGIDTGVRHTHNLLEKNWRQDYGWFDPYNNTLTPNDENGHGSHTMGTVVGSDGYGVAPGATWIACKGCITDLCGAAQLLACGQWVLCPTRPDGRGRRCDKTPRIVSNSWGGSGGDPWYDDVILTWRSAGIIPVFSNGNNGPSCGTVGSPGDSAHVISVGSTDSRDYISPFSSLGPTTDGRIKPDVVAPGDSILSASHESDTTLSTLSGTSMACPHVSGAIALLLENKPKLTYEQVYEILTEGSSRHRNPLTACGNVTANAYPNNIYGWDELMLIMISIVRIILILIN